MSTINCQRLITYPRDDQKLITLPSHPTIGLNMSDSFGCFSVSKSYSQLIGLFYSYFAKNVVFKLVQGEYIRGRVGKESKGVCSAISYKWIQRVLKGKLSFKKESSKESIGQIQIGWSWNQRMADKFRKFCECQLKYSRVDHLYESFGIKVRAHYKIFKRNKLNQDVLKRLADISLSSARKQNIFFVAIHFLESDIGHAIAVHFDKIGQRMTVMDPNFGEFKFETDSTQLSEDSRNFFNVLLETYDKAEGVRLIFADEFILQENATG